MIEKERGRVEYRGNRLQMWQCAFPPLASSLIFFLEAWRGGASGPIYRGWGVEGVGERHSGDRRCIGVAWRGSEFRVKRGVGYCRCCLRRAYILQASVRACVRSGHCVRVPGGGEGAQTGSKKKEEARGGCKNRKEGNRGHHGRKQVSRHPSIEVVARGGERGGGRVMTWAVPLRLGKKLPFVYCCDLSFVYTAHSESNQDWWWARKEQEQERPGENGGERCLSCMCTQHACD